MAALAGVVEWREVTPLPFELACLPQKWFRFLHLPVVSYALPALIAIGQAVFHHRPPANPLTRAIRRRALAKSLQVLERIQPSSGGFLEAVPLTSFVTLSLASIGLSSHQVARQGARFLIESARSDGSWPIDSNLSVWLTTLAVNALTSAGAIPTVAGVDRLRSWLVDQQFHEPHPYTGADPGGWGWTHLPGSVPDVDDTSGALLALANLQRPELAQRAIAGGISWLLEIQNQNGGWPTFCRGWGHLPFDRSGADLTAHAMRAVVTWYERWCGRLDRQSINWIRRKALPRALRYLEASQRQDGSWVPLWFGNEEAPAEENAVYGTARVLAAFRDLDMMDTKPARRGLSWLQGAQNADGGWGGAAAVPSSMEETALAVEILLDAGPGAEEAVNKGLAWLVVQVECGGLSRPAPIGFYFAKLWYFEKLYPVIFTVAALGRARQKFAVRHPRLSQPASLP
jgi:squalene-hopene/tetraprenyl-beta-curcumene cyclase